MWVILKIPRRSAFQLLDNALIQQQTKKIYIRSFTSIAEEGAGLPGTDTVRNFRAIYLRLCCIQYSAKSSGVTCHVCLMLSAVPWEMASKKNSLVFHLRPFDRSKIHPLVGRVHSVSV